MSGAPQSSLLRIHVLGTPEFLLDNRPVTGFNSNKSRALFIYLAVTQQSYTRPSLAGFFWGDMTEEKALTNLRKSIANLRKLFGAHLVINRQTVSFNKESNHWIDAFELAALSDQNPNPTGSFANVKHAIDLYRGDFLEGFYLKEALDFEQWALNQRAAWRNRIYPLFDTTIEHHVQSNEYEEAIRYAARFLEIEPWREEVHRTLMLLFGRLDQRSAALSQYQQCRSALERELGVEPDPLTMALMRRIRYAPTPNHNLPEQNGPLLGRSDELAHIQTLFGNQLCRLVTLTGAGGMGKTHLALEAAERLRSLHLEGAWFADLSSVEDPKDLPLTIATALNFKPTPTEPLIDQLLSFLDDKELLLVLDNFEQLVDANELLVSVLKQAPGVRMIITSRTRLRLKGEHVIVVEGLPVDESAIELFTRSVMQFEPNFNLEANLAAVKEICRLVQGSPLAIELAAAAVHFYPCDYIANAIRDNLDVLQTTMQDVHPRHRSVRAVFDHSWRALNPGEQAAFARLSVFRGSFTLQAALQVCEITPQELSQLVVHSLIRRLPSDRYECHELLRQYAFEALSNDPISKRSTIRRHMKFYLQLLREEGARLLGEESLAAQQRLQLEVNNINFAWDQAFDTLDLEQLTTSLHALVRFYQYAGDLDRYATVLSSLVERLLALAQTGAHFKSAHLSLLSLALASQATVLAYRGEFDAAVKSAQEATDIADELHDKTVKANALVNLAGTHFRRSNYVEMKAALDRLEAIMPTVPDGIEKVRGLNWRGVWHARMGQSAEAMTWYQAALDLARQLHIRSDESFILLNMGLRHEAQNNYAAAEEFMGESLKLARRTGSWRVQGSALASLALIDHRFGRNAQGKARLLEVIQLYHRIGNQLRLGQPYTYLGIICQGSDEFGEAAEYLQTGLRYYREQGNKSGQMMALSYLGQAFAASGRYEAARDLYQETLEIAESMGSADYQLWASILFAELCLIIGDIEQAERQIDNFIAHKDHCRDDQIVTRLATTQASINLLKGDAAQAAMFANEAVELSRGFVALYRIDALARLGDVLVTQGSWGPADKTWRSVLSMRAEIGQAIGQMEAQTNLAWIALAQGKITQAKRHIEAIWQAIEGTKTVVVLGIWPMRMFNTCLAYFQETGDPREIEVRNKADIWLQQRAGAITDEAWRQTFLRTHRLQHSGTRLDDDMEE